MSLKFVFSMGFILLAIIALIYSSILLYIRYWLYYSNTPDIQILLNEKFTEHPSPKTILTYTKKEKIPKKVFTNLDKYAGDYIIFDDNECIDFLKKNYTPEVLDTFNNLNGAHKADLFRYCYLYIHGGIYLDIKTELIKPLDEIFTNPNRIYSVLSILDNSVYQGIISTPARHPFFKKLIQFMVHVPTIVSKFSYSIYTIHFFDTIEDYCQKTPKAGLNISTDKNTEFYLFQEICSSENTGECYDGLDRYGRCCNVYDGNKKIIKTRYADFPWN